MSFFKSSSRHFWYHIFRISRKFGAHRLSGYSIGKIEASFNGRLSPILAYRKIEALMKLGRYDEALSEARKRVDAYANSKKIPSAEKMYILKQFEAIHQAAYRYANNDFRSKHVDEVRHIDLSQINLRKVPDYFRYQWPPEFERRPESFVKK